ncbi:serine hydrolase domain-containing protein [Altererythrobacter sp. Root672]|uniref:serine hydrolase domain-containing protein n=1 Tax=Altererythrobacter sp. Root672 TaxID=1736584 RepID=UPI0006FC5376|nr:serine hydrolase domain-containing protein [Altererythrobacter sp. Root672]KRA82647.1 serine hydrolase [Altererythrobacter sp. Root672]
MRQLKKWIVPLLLLVGAGGVFAQGLVPEAIAPAVGDKAPAQAAPTQAGGAALTKTDVDAWLDGFLPYALESGDIAGAVVVVVKDGQVLTQRGFGYADIDKRIPVSPETTLFRTGSVSKLTTWTAIMQLVEQGKLDLDTDVNKYLDFTIPAYEGKPITLRNIMTHTAGFQETVRRLISDNPEDMVSLGEYVKNDIPARIFPPGEVPAYSNYATALAGRIIERVSGQSYDEYVEQHIFKPLGMTYATFRQPVPANLAPHLSQGYGPGLNKPEKFEYVVPAPAGSQAASGADMAKFMIAHLNDGAGLMKPETAKMMHEFELNSLPPLHAMALGFYRDDVNGHRVLAHGGDTVFMHSNLDLFVDDNVGLFISMNSDGQNGSPRWLREALLAQFADRYFPQELAGKPIDEKTAREHAQMLAGTYASSRGFETNFMSMLDLVGQEKVGVDEKGGILVGSAANAAGQPRKWIEVEPFVWRDRDSGMKLAAKVEDGKVTEWRFDTISAIMSFRRVPWYKDTAWFFPVLLGAIGVVFLSAVAWPAGAIARRRYKAASRYEGRRLRSQRILHGAQWLVLAVLTGWVTWFYLGLSNLSMLSGPLDPLLYALQILSPIALFGLLIGSGWNLWTARKEKRGWFALLWAVLLVLSAVVLLWMAFAFHMFSFGTNY